MLSVSQVMGIACAVVMVLVTLICVVSAVAKILDKAYEKGRQAGYDEARRTLCDRSFWFGKHRPTQYLLQRILSDEPLPQVRDKWTGLIGKEISE